MKTLRPQPAHPRNIRMLTTKATHFPFKKLPTNAAHDKKYDATTHTTIQHDTYTMNPHCSETAVFLTVAIQAHSTIKERATRDKVEIQHTNSKHESPLHMKRKNRRTTVTKACMLIAVKLQYPWPWRYRHMKKSKTASNKKKRRRLTPQKAYTNHHIK